MKKVVVLFIFTSFVLCLMATAFTIGAGTYSTYNTPINAFYDYSWSRSIYTRAEINAAGLNSAQNIVSLAIQVNETPSNFLMENQFIYMRHTTATAETAPYSGTTGFTLVYSGPILFITTGWKIIDLTSPFAWNNTDNIEILWESYDGSYQMQYPAFLHHTTTGSLTVYVRQDFSFPLVDGFLTTDRPNLMLYSAGTSGPEQAIVVNPLNGAVNVSHQPTLNWTSGGGAPTGYRLYFGTTNPPPLIGDLGTATSWTSPATLSFNTPCYWKVIPYNTDGDASDCPVWSFTTRTEWDIFVGTGEVTAPIPVNTSSDRSYCQFIYKAEDMTAIHHKISAISFHWISEFDNIYSNDIVVYMGNTDRDTFFSELDFMPLDSLTVVYNGHLDLSAGDRWITIPVSPHFNYDITKNLLIAVDENTTGNDGENFGKFYLSLSTNNESMLLTAVNNNGADVLPSDPVGSAQYTNVAGGYPNIWITTVDDVPLTPPVVSITKSASGPQLSWDAVPGAPYYNIFSSPYPYNWGFPNNNYENTVTGTTYTYPNSGSFDERFFRVISTTDIPSRSLPVSIPGSAAGDCPLPPDMPQILQE
jgi:hypothetical protein